MYQIAQNFRAEHQAVFTSPTTTAARWTHRPGGGLLFPYDACY